MYLVSFTLKRFSNLLFYDNSYLYQMMPKPTQTTKNKKQKTKKKKLGRNVVSCRHTYMYILKPVLSHLQTVLFCFVNTALQWDWECTYSPLITRGCYRQAQQLQMQHLSPVRFNWVWTHVRWAFIACLPKMNSVNCVEEVRTKYS